MQIGTCVSPLKQAAGLTRLPSTCRVNVARRTSVAVSAASRPNAAPAEVAKALAVSSVAASLMASGNAHAASELAAIAANDGRFGAITLLFLPALGWVAFNIFGPALNQLDTMKNRGVLAGLGLSAAALLAAQSADASELAQLAATDNRGSILFLLFVPAIAWVGFNILGPALNQLDNMKKGAVAGAGLSAAALLAAQSADAAEIAQLAAGDNRTSVLALLFVPALAWVGFNIFGPALNQLDNMKSRGAIAGLGLSAAALLAAQSAEAAEIAQLAAGDNRGSVLLLLFVPALAWVGFNILGPALNQVDNMRNK